MIDLDDLSQRLRSLGDALVFDDDGLADSVIGRVDNAARHRRFVWPAAAAVLLTLAAVALIPDSRHAVARWFGLERVTVDVDPDVTGTAAPITLHLPGPGQSTVVEVDGRQILVSTVDGTLTPVL